MSLKIFGPWRGGGCVVVANLYMGMSSTVYVLVHILHVNNLFLPVVVEPVLFLQDFFQKINKISSNVYCTYICYKVKILWKTSFL